MAGPKISNELRVLTPLGAFCFDCESVVEIEGKSGHCEALREDGRLPGVEEETNCTEWTGGTGRCCSISSIGDRKSIQKPLVPQS